MATKDTHTALALTFTKTVLPDSEVKLAGEIPFEAIAPFDTEALLDLAKELELPGFRKGHVPPEMARKTLGDAMIMEEAVELFMHEFYPALIEAHTIDAVGRPNIRITKLAPGNPVGIEITTAIYPEVTLPKDWKKLGEKTPLEAAAPVEDKALDEALLSIRRARAKAEDTESTPESEVPEDKLPALDDAFAQSLGKFTDLNDLKTKLRENMQQEKVQQAKEKRRGKIVEDLLEKTTVAVPHIFVESELEKIVGQLKDDVTRFGMSFEDYLKRMEKTEEQVRQDFTEQATKRAKLQLALNKIADDEKVEADKEAVETELKHAMEHFPDARPELVRIHIETVLRNEQVLKLLEGEDISKPESPKVHDHSDNSGHSHE